jgi:hypothetical protein
MTKEARDDDGKNEESPLLVTGTATSVPRNHKHSVLDAAARVLVVSMCMVVPSVLVLYLVFVSHGYSAAKPAIAFIGNSMQYQNDLPRLIETMSGESMTQNSCLHGGTTLHKILQTGNGMFDKFNTSRAILQDDFYGSGPVFDFGACTVEQLLFGYDSALEQQVYWKTGYLVDDGTNPCLQNGRYYDYLVKVQKDRRLPPFWDFIVLNDNTQSPGLNHSRQESLAVLTSHYLPWLRTLGARTGHGTVPVFLHTHAYYTVDRNLTGLADQPDDIPHFTSVTYAVCIQRGKTCICNVFSHRFCTLCCAQQGYQLYYQLLKEALPKSQEPRIAPVGLAFLIVWEENRDLWQTLFHFDHLHASPSGSFLTACVMHHTLFEKLPDHDVLFAPMSRRRHRRGPPRNMDDSMSHLWDTARVMQQADQPPNPFPTRKTAMYLYRVCQRVTVEGERPKSWVDYYPAITAQMNKH